MLGKMIKHEFIATGRSFLPLYLFMIVLTPIFSIIMKLGHDNKGNLGIINFLAAFCIFGFIVMMIGIFIASYILIVLRFYRTTATSEAYLTFTLPVSTHHIILSKLLAAFVWQVVSAVLVILCVLSMNFIIGTLSPADVLEQAKYLISDLSQELSSPAVYMLPVMVIVGALSGTLQYFCSIILGQLFRDHRVIGSIGVYLVLSTVTQILSLIVVFPIAWFFVTTNPNGVRTESFYNTLIFVISIVLNLALGVVYYFITSYVMKRRLNVQ